MAPKTRTRLATWLTHRRFMAIEGVLLAGVAQMQLESRVLALPVPRWSRVLLVIALVIGLFAVFVAVVRATTRSGVSSVHGISRRLMFPRALAHMVILTGIYWLYAMQLGLW